MIRDTAERILAAARAYLFFAALFLLEKPLFLAFHHGGTAGGTGAGDWLDVMWNGLPMDLSVAAYFAIVPALLAALSAAFSIPLAAWNAYFALALALVWAITVPDVDVYGYWGTHMDAPTILFYLKDPGDVAASFTLWMVVRDGLLILLGFAVSWLAFTRLVRPIQGSAALRPSMSNASSDAVQASAHDSPASKGETTKGLFLGRGLPMLCAMAAGGLLFIPARGGLTTATMNVGRVYFSQNAFLNHAAVSPVWNFLDSFNWKRDFAQQYRYLDGEEAKELADALRHPGPRKAVTGDVTDGGTALLTTSKPNILLVILESFSGNFIQPLGGDADVMPRISALFDESIAFTRIHASGTRTDSGVVAVLGGYPAQPRSRIMARPDKSLAIAGIGKTLAAHGYDLSFYYGGDEDFANMRSYLVGNGFEKIQGEGSFPKDEVRTKWGVYDHVLYGRLLQELDEWQDLSAGAGKEGRSVAPFFKVALSLTSHEPFQIPVPPRFPGDGLAERYKSSLHYADGALGDFIDAAKAKDWWKDTLVILVADHSTHYPDLKIHQERRYLIPLLWTGGAVRTPATIDAIGSQTDLAATLLGEMGIDHGDFPFSKDLLDPDAPKNAFYTFNEGFGFVDDTGASAFDCGADKALNPSDQPDRPPEGGAEDELRIRKGKALLQRLFDDLASLTLRK